MFIESLKTITNKRSVLYLLCTLLMMSCSPLEQFEPASTPGQWDINTLALEWYPGFCKNNPQLNTCDPDASAYFNNNLSLHGLWPDKKNGSAYSFCDDTIVLNPDLCKNPPLDGVDEVALYHYMPGTKVCLDRYEWIKHGTCQYLNPKDYFALAVSFLEQVNQSSFGQYIQKNIGMPLTLKSLYLAFDQSFGENAHKALSISCYNDTEIIDFWIQLKKNINLNDKVKDVILPNTHATVTKCSDTIIFTKLS